MLLIKESVIPFFTSNNILKIFIYKLTYSLFFFYERNVRTVPLIIPLQIGHFLREGAQSLQTTRWPQGINTMDTSLSIHTLHVLSSCSLLNCSSIGKSKKREKVLIKGNLLLLLQWKAKKIKNNVFFWFKLLIFYLKHFL